MGIEHGSAFRRHFDLVPVVSNNPQDVQQIDRWRFPQTAAYRNRVWNVLTRSFFIRWISSDAPVLDLGCGYGEFINNIAAGHKYATRI
jgi:hypothetical protein